MNRFLGFPVVVMACALQLFGFAATAHQDVITKASALFQAGKADEAEGLLRQASTADPDSGPLHGELGKVLLSEHKYEDAVMELGQAAQQMPESRQYNLLAAEALIGWKRYPTAVQFLKAIQPRFGKDAHFHYQLGVAYYYESNLNATRTELEEAVRLSPNFERAEFLLANCLVVSGETPRALTIFRKLALKHPNNAFYWATLGVKLAHVNTGAKPQEAVDAVHRALALAPDDPYVQFAAANVFTEAGDYKSARPLLEQLEKLDPKELEPHALLVRVYARLGERDMAQQESKIVDQLQKEAAAQHPATAPGGGTFSSPPQP